MPIDYTDILITVSDLRERIGGPSNNPNSESYVTDAMLTSIIDHKREIASEIVERKMESLTNDQIKGMDITFDIVDIAVVASDFVAQGVIPDDNLPVEFRVIDSSGNHYEYDIDIYGTANINAGTGFTKRRYDFLGNDLRIIPNTNQNMKMWLPTKDEIRQILVVDVIEQVNNDIINEARKMIRDRVAVAQGFKVEAQNEGTK